MKSVFPVEKADIPVNDDPDIQTAIDVVLSFTTKMNEWETRRYYRDRVDHGYEFTAERDKERAGEKSAAELDEEYVVHFKSHCTDRKRTYSGWPSHFGKPPTYVGVDRESVVECVRPKTNRIEVVCTGGAFPDQRFKFVMFKKTNGWRIDNAYSWIGVNGEWERHLL